MYAFDSEIKYISRKNLLPIYFKEKSMKILATIKAALKKAGIPEKYAAKVQALFDIESEENLDNYIGLFKDNILPDLVSNEQGSQASIDAAIAAYEKKHGLKDGKPIETTKTKKTKNPPTTNVFIMLGFHSIVRLLGIATVIKIAKIVKSPVTIENDTKLAALSEAILIKNEPKSIIG